MLILGLAPGVFLVDFATKLLVQNSVLPYQQIQVVGDFLRITRIYNPGAAFGLSLGPYSREIVLAATAVVLVALGFAYFRTAAMDRVRQVAIALICGGALGNMLDRIRSPRGVLDFLDVGFGDLRWPVFNFADIAVTTGAILLALSLWGEQRRAEDGDAVER